MALFNILRTLYVMYGLRLINQRFLMWTMAWYPAKGKHNLESYEAIKKKYNRMRDVYNMTP